jgi:hypothetical protein
LITRREFLASSAGLALWMEAARAVAASTAPASMAEAGSIPLGKLDRFWRYSAALGPYLEIGNGLMPVPDYLMSGDFPYCKRPFPQEVLFADELSIVRLLGGYLITGESEAVLAERDLAYRKDGKIQYRLQILRPRLQPYIDSGYDKLTLVLDNVPYCFPAEPVLGDLGQIAPPSDPCEWKAFIVKVAEWIVEIFGPEKASRLRFRVGTENNSPDRWSGTQARYIQHYEDSAAAVREIIPSARISFYNISSAIVDQIPTQNVNSFALAQQCYENVPVTPIDFIAFSDYYWEYDDPQQNSEQCAAVWEKFGELVPALKNCSREIQEQGIATWLMTAAGQPSRSEPGALGAAQLFQMAMWLKVAGTKRLWHWNPLDTEIRDAAGQLRSLPTGQAWVFLVLEQMAGGEAFLFPIAERGDGVKRLAAASVKEDSAVIVASAYHPSEATGPAETIEFRLPSAVMGSTPRIARLNAKNCVHSLVRNDLAAAGLLAEGFGRNPQFLGYVREMEYCPDGVVPCYEGEFLAAENESKYLAAWTDSLTLRPMTADDGMIDGNLCRLRIGTPEIVVVALQENAISRLYRPTTWKQK